MGRITNAIRALVGPEPVLRRDRSPLDDFWYSMAGQQTETGVKIDEEKALESTALYSGIALIADCMGMVPCHVYRSTDGGANGRRTEVADNEPLDRVLSLAPNPMQSAFEFWRWMFAQLKVRGNAYAEIDRHVSGEVLALWPLNAENVEITYPALADGEPVYSVRMTDGSKRVMRAGKVLHLSDFHSSGFVAKSNLMRHKESIGLTIALEKYAAKFFGSGGNTGSVLIFPPDADFSKADKALFRAEFESLNSGLENAHRVAIIEEGAQYHQVGISPKDSQAIDCRTYQVGEASRMLRVPRVMLGDLADAHQKNIEHLFIQFVTLTLQPLAVMAQQKMAIRLLDKPELSVRFSTEVIQKADMLTRVEAHLNNITHGIMTLNEARDEIGLNPYDGDTGNHPLVISNLMTLDNILAAPVPGTTGPGSSEPQDPSESVDGDPGTRAAHTCAHGHAHAHEGRELRAVPERVLLRDDYEPLFLEALIRAAKREGSEISGLAKKYLDVGDMAGFAAAVDDFYGPHQRKMREMLETAATAYAGNVARAAAAEVGITDPADVADLVDNAIGGVASVWSRESQATIAEALASGALPDEIRDRITEAAAEWTGDRAKGQSTLVAGKIETAATQKVWAQGGVTKIRWQTSSPCELCAPLQGKIVQIYSSFVSSGSEIVPDNGNSPLKIKRSVTGPPLHLGCKCWLMPEGLL